MKGNNAYKTEQFRKKEGHLILKERILILKIGKLALKTAIIRKKEGKFLLEEATFLLKGGLFIKLCQSNLELKKVYFYLDTIL